MPDWTHPHWGHAHATTGRGAGVVGYAHGGHAAAPSGPSGSRPGSCQYAVASTSRPTSAVPLLGYRLSDLVCPAAGGTTDATVVEGRGEERRELPELVLGVVGFEVEEAREVTGMGGIGEVEGVERVGEEGKGKEVERGNHGEPAAARSPSRSGDEPSVMMDVTIP